MVLYVWLNINLNLQVAGGYYADPEGECQVFHICAGGPAGELFKFNFLCPNGTIFNQVIDYHPFEIIAGWVKINNKHLYMIRLSKFFL